MLDAAIAAAASAAAGARAAPTGQENWMQMMGLGGMPGLDPASLAQPPAASGSASRPAAENPFASLDLASILGQLQNNTSATLLPSPPPAADVPSLESDAMDLATPPQVDLTLLNDPEAVTLLLPYLPADQQTPDHLSTTLRSQAFSDIYATITPASANDNVASGISTLSLNSTGEQVYIHILHYIYVHTT